MIIESSDFKDIRLNTPAPGSDWYGNSSLRENSKEAARESWAEIKNKIKAQWSKLLEEDLEALKDNKELLVAKLQQVYGHAKERAEKEYNEFLKSLQTSRAKSKEL